MYARSARLPRGGRGARASQSPGPLPGNAGTWTGGCKKARVTGSYSYGQVRSAYGVDAARDGAGASVALMNVGEGVPASDIRLGGRVLRAAADTPARAADGRPGAPVRLRLGGAPARPRDGARHGARRCARSSSRRCGSSPNLWFLGPAQTLAAGSLPDSLSISYGICERDLRGRHAGRRRARAPTCSRRCSCGSVSSASVRSPLPETPARPATTTTSRASPFPASSPYAHRGGRHAARARRRRTRASTRSSGTTCRGYNGEDGGGAGGGGLSQFSSRPPWQAGLPVAGTRRAAPDVSAHASLLPGWPVALGDNWLGVGGTSAAVAADRRARWRW